MTDRIHFPVFFSFPGKYEFLQDLPLFIWVLFGKQQTNKNLLKAGEMAQSVKHLPCMLKDLSSILRTHIKMGAWWHVLDPSAGDVERGFLAT